MIEVGGNGLRVERQFGRIVGVGDFGLASLGDGADAARGVVGGGHVRGVVAVVGELLEARCVAGGGHEWSRIARPGGGQG